MTPPPLFVDERAEKTQQMLRTIQAWPPIWAGTSRSQLVEGIAI